MQAKRQKVVAPAGDDAEDPIFSNDFFLTPELAKAVGPLVTYIVYNHDKDPAVSMFPSDNDFRDMLYQHIDEDEELTHLLLGEDANDAFMEVSGSVHMQDVLCSRGGYWVFKREATH